MNADDLKLLLREVEELKALLVFTERTIPFLEDVIAFVRDIVPMVEELKSSVEASAEKLPGASSQLDKVSTATELATTEILNIVEAVMAKVDRIRKETARDRQYLGSVQASARKMDALVASRNGAASTGDWAVAVTAAWDAHLSGLEQGSAEAGTDKALVSIQDDCTNIMIALQVQDITAQQIAAVNTLMRSVDQGLNRLLRHFTNVATEQNDPRFRSDRLDIVFDSTAEYGGGAARQRVADAVVESIRHTAERKRSNRKRKQ